MLRPLLKLRAPAACLTGGRLTGLSMLLSSVRPGKIRGRYLSSAPPGDDPGTDHDLPGPKPFDTGNTPLGKGFDVLADLPGSRPKCVISGYDPWGFDVGEVSARGSIIALPNSYLLWKPRRIADVTLESLKLVALIKPRVEMLLVGSGGRMSEPLDHEIIAFFQAKGIVVELMDTVNACATFNVLNAEDRMIAAALLTISEEEEP